jgi:hypothetical protein
MPGWKLAALGGSVGGAGRKFSRRTFQRRLPVKPGRFRLGRRVMGAAPTVTAPNRTNQQDKTTRVDFESGFH